jgi:hypothetical protein
MHTAHGSATAPASTTGARTAAATLAVVGFVCLVGVAVVSAAREVRGLDDRRREALAVPADPASSVGAAADAFRRFRAGLAAGQRFALVYGPDVDRDERGFYRLFAGYYLYPAIAVPDPRDADAVMVFGTPAPPIVSAFEPVATVDGVWLGRRRAT